MHIAENKLSRGLFISVEGIDGAGKSTHVSFIKEYLEGKNLSVVTTREPGGTALSEKIREILLNNSYHMQPITELFLMFASRQELVSNVVIPNLEKGVSIVADRFIDASIAYQGVGRNLGVDKVKQIIALLDPQIQTDLTFLFDTTLDVAYRRVVKNKVQDRIELEGTQFFEKVKNAYLEIGMEEPNRVKIINTNNEIHYNRELIKAYIDQLILDKQLNETKKMN